MSNIPIQSLIYLVALILVGVFIIYNSTKSTNEIEMTPTATPITLDCIATPIAVDQYFIHCIFQ